MFLFFVNTANKLKDLQEQIEREKNELFKYKTKTNKILTAEEKQQQDFDSLFPDYSNQFQIEEELLQEDQPTTQDQQSQKNSVVENVELQRKQFNENEITELFSLHQQIFKLSHERIRNQQLQQLQLSQSQRLKRTSSKKRQKKKQMATLANQSITFEMPEIQKKDRLLVVSLSIEVANVLLKSK